MEMPGPPVSSDSSPRRRVSSRQPFILSGKNRFNFIAVRLTHARSRFTDRIQPWVHYVPVQIDLSDLWDAFSFFRGDLNDDLGHDNLAKKIGAQGREWSLNFWRHEDLVAYNFRSVFVAIYLAVWNIDIHAA